MHTLPLSFSLLTYSGYWRPVKWSSYSYKYWFYNIYSAFMVLLLHTFAFCGLVDSFVSKDMKTIVDRFSLFISVLGVCCKVINLLVRREKIISVVNILLDENCTPRNEEERIIQKRSDRHARRLTIFCEILNECAVFFATVGQLDKFMSTRTLPLANWVPYDLSSETVYRASLFHQTFGLVVCANTSVGHETLISGLMIQICAQLDILCHRARTLPILVMDARKFSRSEEDFKIRQRKIVRDLIKNHLDVYRFAWTVNTVFNFMIFIQFSISSTVLCLSVYKMSNTDLFTVEFLWSSSYLCCMLMQVYLYCWYGNEVTLKSQQISDAVYEMDWTILPTDLIKSLLLVMKRSTRPIKMSSGYIVTLSAQSFMAIMKISYSSYNLLKDSSRK